MRKSHQGKKSLAIRAHGQRSPAIPDLGLKTRVIPGHATTTPATQDREKGMAATSRAEMRERNSAKATIESIVWMPLGTLAAIAVLARILHNKGVASGRTASMLICGLNPTTCLG